MQAGYQYANEHDYDIAIQVDADGQHGATKIPGLISKIKDGEYDLAIGSRYVAKTRYTSSFLDIRELNTVLQSCTYYTVLKLKIPHPDIEILAE